MNDWLAVGMHALSTNTTAVWLVAGLIAAGALTAYWGWFARHITKIETALDELIKVLEEHTNDWNRASSSARAAADLDPAVANAWRQTESRVLQLPHGDRYVPAMLGAPRDLWSPQSLLTRSFNLSLAEAVPNLLVGIGLLFTFVFLTIALTEATSALTVQDDANADIMSATRGLLGAAGAKFTTSLAGLFASIVWTIAARRRMNSLGRLCERVIDRIDLLVPPTGGEMLLVRQIGFALALDGASQKQLQLTEQHQQISEEILFEAREQTGTLKRFETDLAVTLAGAITNAFGPQMEAMTDRLVGSIDALSDRLGTMNQNALQKMLEDFAAMLKKATELEMSELRKSLDTLAERLTTAGHVFGTGAGVAAGQIEKAGNALGAAIETAATALAAGASNLEEAASSVKLALNDLDTSISEAATLGREGKQQFRSILDDVEASFESLNDVSDSLGTLVTNLDGATTRLGGVINHVDNLSSELMSITSAVTDKAPVALASIKTVSTSLATASDALTATVDTLRTGVHEYSNSISKLHKDMDAKLAQAIGKLGTTVNDLSDVLEEFNENLATLREKY